MRLTDLKSARPLERRFRRFSPLAARLLLSNTFAARLLRGLGHSGLHRSDLVG